MTNLDSLDNEAKEYFYSLPSIFQTQIIESGVTFNSKEDIEKYYSSVLSNNKTL